MLKGKEFFLDCFATKPVMLMGLTDIEWYDGAQIEGTTIDDNKEKIETGWENKKNRNKRRKEKELEREEERHGKQETAKEEESPTVTSREDSSGGEFLRSIMKGSNVEESAKKKNEERKLQS